MVLSSWLHSGASGLSLAVDHFKGVPTLLNQKKWRSVLELSEAMADYIENFYNAQRRHSSLGYLTPDEFDAKQQTTQTILI